MLLHFLLISIATAVENPNSEDFESAIQRTILERVMAQRIQRLQRYFGIDCWAPTDEQCALSPLSNFKCAFPPMNNRTPTLAFHVTNMKNILSILECGLQVCRHTPGMSAGKGDVEMVEADKDKNFVTFSPNVAHGYVNRAVIFGYIPAIVVFDIGNIPLTKHDLGEMYTFEDIPSGSITQIWLPDLIHATEMKNTALHTDVETDMEKIVQAVERNTQHERSIIGMSQRFASEKGRGDMEEEIKAIEGDAVEMEYIRLEMLWK